MVFPTTTQLRRLPEDDAQVINRKKSLVFTFDGRQYSAFEGDTIASALTAAGAATFTRSLKYHRRRGLLCAAGNCPNCLVQIGDEPDVRACCTPVQDGMTVKAQNAAPSLDFDVLNVTEALDRFLPAGYAYKAFMRPRSLWPAYEYYLRHTQGFGKVDLNAQPGYFDKEYKHADVTVVGGGPTGMTAALAAADLGARVILMETESALGGHLRYATHEIEGKPAYQYAAELAAKVMAHANIEVLTGTTAFGRYDENWIGAAQGNRLIKLRTQSLVVASGSYEIPLLFENNDLPGIMLGSAVRRLIHLYGALPGTRAMLVSANSRGLQTALDLIAVKVQVQAVVEMSGAPDADLIAQIKKAGVRVINGASIVKASEALGRVSSVTLQIGNKTEDIECDLLVLSTGYMPAYELLYQAGTKLVWDAQINEFTPGTLPEGVFAAGEAVGTHDLVDAQQEGAWSGTLAAQAAGLTIDSERAEADGKAVSAQRAQRVAWTTVSVPAKASRHEMVCL
ncbi:MAG TPA: 2Fe-2S iron-sulfur cluster-binding protein, partial [Phototrophicaceae bacterium]|nr:2Fe-2S iron-sulfur cluster-binding protein [Phototrophicaceae bacterium]